MINSFEIGTLKFILENFTNLSEYRRLETEILEKNVTVILWLLCEQAELF